MSTTQPSASSASEPQGPCFTLNGEARSATAGTSLADLVAELGLQGKRIAVEHNGDIVPRSQYSQRLIAADDHIEIVGAVGGG